MDSKPTFIDHILDISIQATKALSFVNRNTKELSNSALLLVSFVLIWNAVKLCESQGIHITSIYSKRNSGKISDVILSWEFSVPVQWIHMHNCLQSWEIRESLLKH